MATLVEINYDLAKLSRAMQLYGVASGKAEADVIVKQSGKLAYNIRAGLREIAPSKGSVKAEVLSGLRSGQGIKIRPAVMLAIFAKAQAVSSIATGETYYALRKGKTGRGKIVGFQAGGLFQLQSGKMGNIYALAAERELNIRESARGFLAYSSSFRSYGEAIGRGYESAQSIYSRYGFVLSELKLDVKPESQYKFAKFTWVPPKGIYDSAVEGLTKERQLGIINDAIRETTADVMVYVNQRLGQAAAQTGFN